MTRRNLHVAILLVTLFLAGAVLVPAGPACFAAEEVAPAAAAAPVDRKEIEAGVNCPCEDNCGKLLANCVCGFSDNMRKELDSMIAAGMTKTEILEALVKRYGIRVLASPGTSNWLDRLSWIAPFLALALGGWWVVRVARRFVSPARGKESAAPESPEPSPNGAAVSSAYERRLDEELSRFER
ncbi:MAG: cytochrome c-type biogenesis protein CcmH [Deltaproteobacteria bacterium]|nr:cytochrome c-type biogenesis protein CcmH [Deltaproteobacteria bacterium]